MMWGRQMIMKMKMMMGSGNGDGAAAVTAASVRYMSRKCTPNLRKVNPKVTPQEAASIAENLYYLIRQHGRLTVSNTWNHAKEAGISGLNSKTHMKLLLKWMQGRNMLKLSCFHVGSSKKFLLSTLPEGPQMSEPDNTMELKPKTQKAPKKKKKTKSK